MNNLAIIALSQQCNNSSCMCKGKGYLICDQPTTGIKSKHRCWGGSFESVPFEYIYPEFYPKEKMIQPEQPIYGAVIIERILQLEELIKLKETRIAELECSISAIVRENFK